MKMAKYTRIGFYYVLNEKTMVKTPTPPSVVEVWVWVCGYMIVCACPHVLVSVCVLV